MIDIKSFSKPKKSGNGSGGGSSSVTYISGIASEADHATRADKAKKAEVAEQANVANRATSAQTANYASKAGEVDIESETLQKFLRKDDPAEGEENVAEEVRRKVDFKKAATFLKAADMLKGFTAHELAAFLKGFTIAGQFGIDEYGDMILNTIKSLEYNNAAEQGFSIEKEKNGKYHAFVTNLTIWGKAIFHELEVRKLSYSGGNIYLSGAGSKLVKVIPVKKSVSDGVTSWVETTADDTECVGWKCYLLADNGTTATMNYWQEDDQVRCQTIGEITAGGTYQDASNKSYWRTIPNGGVSTQNEKIYGTMTETYLDEAGKEQTREVQVELYGGQSFAWIVVGKHSEDLDGYTDEDSAPTETRGIPADGDTIVLDGNRHRNEHGEYDKTDRQNVIVLETTGEYAPRIACYANISEYKHTITKSVNGEDKEVSLSVFETSPKGGTKINSSRFEWISNDGSTINIINYRGDWVKGNTYHKNDQVNHNNAVWVCVANSEESVIAEPSDSSTQWKKVLYGGKGEKGDDAVIYTLEASPSYIRLNSDGSIDYTNGYIDKGDEYESDKYLVVRGYKVVKGVRDYRFSTESSPVTLRLTINDGSAYSEYTPSDGDSVSIDFEPKYEDSYYSMLQEISNSGLNSVRVDMCEGSEYNTNKILATCDIPIIRNGKDGQKGDQGDKGEDGVDGTDGKDAVSVLVENAPLVFDTNDDGIVSPDISKIAKVKIMRGNRNVSDECSDVYSRDDMCVNCKCGVTQENGYISVSISSNNITKNDVIVDGVSHGKVSATSGYAVAQAAYDGVTYFAQVPFSVNVAKFTGVVAFDNNGYKSQFEEVTNRLKDTATKDDLKKAESDFKQTAREISLTVSEKAMGRRNMLPGSAFRKGDDGFEMSIYGDFDGSTYTKGYRGNQGIFMNGGVSGSNFFRVKSYYDGSEQQYGGLFWRGGGASKNIKVQANKKYVLSCWVKCDRTDVTISLEAIYNASETTMTRPGRPSTTTNNFHVSKANTWQLISCIVTTDGSFNYVEVNFWVSHKINGVTATACFCHPMFEEAEEYNGWTLSKLDYDYIGGNLIDNSRTFASGGNCNVRTKYGSIIANGYNSESSVFKARMEALAGSVPSKYSLPSSASSGTRYALDSDWSVWQYNGNSLSDDSHYNGWQKTNESLHQDIMLVNLNLELNKDYIISWYAKCEGKGLFGAYAADVGKTVYSEYSDGGIDQSTYGENIFFLTTQWKRFWMHVKLIKGSCSAIIFRQYRGDLSSGSSAMTVYFTQPKIEEGATVTDWTEKRTDMVDRQALLATGIDITNGKITITANNTIFRDNNGTTIALFANGKINASLIDADKIEVKHLWAKSNDGASKVGYFGNTEEDACKIGDYTVAPLFIGGATAKESPFYVTSKGAMHATSGKIGYFTISPNGELMYDDGYTDVAHRPFGLSKEALYFTHTTRDHKSNDAIVWVGRTNFSESSTGTVGLLSDIWIDERVSTPTQSKACLFLSAEGYTGEDTDYKGDLMGNFAIYAKKGAYAGFRPAVRFAIENCQLTDMDCVIYVSVTGVYLILPDNPQRGQYYKFIQGAGSFHIKSSSKNIYSMHVGQTDNFTSDSYNQITEIIWLGDHWRINWFRESVGK